MQLLVVTAAADQTGRTISLLVAGLVGIAVALAALTVWYWRHTDPKRRIRSQATPAPPTIEMLEPLQDRADRGDGTGTGRPLPDDAAADVPRPVVASVPPSSRSSPLPHGEHGVDSGVDGDEPQQWVDPDVWVDAFAFDSGAVSAIPEPEPPPDLSHPAPLWAEAGLEPEPAGFRPVGDSLSDVDWETITRTAFAKFAETESPGSVDIADQSPVR